MAYTTPIPGVSQYGMAANAAKLAYQQALARVGRNRSQLLQQHGYSGEFDESGNLKKLNVDAQNPYGLFQQNRRAHALAAEQLAGNMQTRGISGGLARQAEGRARYDWGADDAEQGRGLVYGLGGLALEQGAAYDDFNTALGWAQLSAAQNAIQNQDFNQADYSGLEYAPPASNSGGGGSSKINAPAYNPMAYVRGGAPLNVARATQAQGYSSMLPQIYNRQLGYVRGGAPANVARATQKINNAIMKAKPKKGGRR